MNGEKAFKCFFKGLSKFPQFKKKRNQDVKAYFPKNNITDWVAERHRVKIPTLGFMRLKERGYIPTNAKITSGTVLIKAGRYYVSVLVDEAQQSIQSFGYSNGIGVDLGVKDFVITSNHVIIKNINKSSRVRKLERKLRREQRRLSRKYEMKKRRGGKPATSFANIGKQLLKVQRIHQKLGCIREDHVNKSVISLVKTKPAHITLEDLNVKGMMKNRHLSKAVAQQNFYNFKIKLQAKCKSFGIELRIVDRFYPSSKQCSACGSVKKDLKLSDRTYICHECGVIIDRDLNAAINLRDAKKYTIAS